MDILLSKYVMGTNQIKTRNLKGGRRDTLGGDPETRINRARNNRRRESWKERQKRLAAQGGPKTAPSITEAEFSKPAVPARKAPLKERTVTIVAD